VRIGIVGCGVVGAAIAYRLSKAPGFSVQVFDQRRPETLSATGAALGVMMAAISSKLKGRHLQLRLESWQLYEALIPELLQNTGLDIPFNPHGVLQLQFDETELARWEKVQAVRQGQGFALEIWSVSDLFAKLPELRGTYALETGQSAVGAVYSPRDFQIDPTALTQAFLQGAVQQGAEVHFESPVIRFQRESGQELEEDANTDKAAVTQIFTPSDQVCIDAVIVAAGLGSMPLTQALGQAIPIQPVLGQALRLKSPMPLRPQLPVVNGNDVHLVPLRDDELWVGATVEFSDAATVPVEQAVLPDPQRLDQVLQQAIALYPALADAQVLHRWSGLRPRPNERAAPVIERLPGYRNVFIASGHYRNGVLLAPITAEKIWTLLQGL
jgi:glycine oxidase